MNNETINNSLERVIENAMFNYRGCIVTKLIGGYEVLGKKVLDMKGVNDVIDEAAKSISHSIKKQAT